MGLDLEYTEGQTPIDEDEKAGLKIKSISTTEELDQFEQQNIEEAVSWTYGRSFTPDQVLSLDFIQSVHKRMFRNVWKWAGDFRTSEKNLGVSYYTIRQELKGLLDDCKYWIENEIFSPAEIAVRFKHRLVSIHLFPNGNGRHSRLMGDILLKALDSKQSFSWGGKTLRNGDDRTAYLKALRAADDGDIDPLVKFAKS
ncbi:MAG: mobile mystery protein B [Saprospiraceae bacterium]